MDRLISVNTPKKLIAMYVNNPIFNAVVTKHEIIGSSYTEMLEDAVAELDNYGTRMLEIALSYENKYGANIDDV